MKPIAVDLDGSLIYTDILYETFLNAFNPIADEEMCASLTPSFCPEIIDLLQYKQLTTKKTLSRLIPSIQEYGFDEHVHGLC